MTIRDNILTYLLDHPDTVVSGQSLADHLGVSRNAVWKGFNQLREEGYGIISHSNKGYQLDQRSHLLDAVQICYGITSLWPDLTINVSEETTSTNDLAKQFAINHPGHSALFITKKQTKGRGRQGRSFYSHLNDGLYFSLVISPGNILPNDVTLYTIITATAVLQALEDLSGKTLAVKWVNDLFYDGRKIGGILCEATTDLETKQLTSLVIGVGLNLAGEFQTDDRSVTDIAGTLFGATPPDDFNQNSFMNLFLTYFGQYHKALYDYDYLPTYASHLLGIGKKVDYTLNDQQYNGTIEGINQSGNLLIRDDTGTQHILVGGEIHFSSLQFKNQ